MEFDVYVHTKLNGYIVIEDLSRQYNLYLSESSLTTESHDFYKYSESMTLNVITSQSTTQSLLLDTLISDHSDLIDSCEYSINHDGLHIIDHIVLPNLTWLSNTTKAYRQSYETIYVTDGVKIYKCNYEDIAGVEELQLTMEECSIANLVESNLEGTTILRCQVYVFFVGNLHLCYINICKLIFNTMLNSCPELNVNTYYRDFLWMTLNVIDYLVGFNQYMEAQRILERVTSCGGFCNFTNTTIKSNNCGCTKV